MSSNSSPELAEEIKLAISKLKESILKLDDTSEERKLLVRQLINFRITLQELEENNGETKNVKRIQGHRFTLQGLTQIKFNTSQLFCEICSSLIWLPLQSWSACAGN